MSLLEPPAGSEAVCAGGRRTLIWIVLRRSGNSTVVAAATGAEMDAATTRALPFDTTATTGSTTAEADTIQANSRRCRGNSGGGWESGAS